jgi:hypothetical protein
MAMHHIQYSATPPCCCVVANLCAVEVGCIMLLVNLNSTCKLCMPCGTQQQTLTVYNVGAQTLSHLSMLSYCTHGP